MAAMNRSPIQSPTSHHLGLAHSLGWRSTKKHPPSSSSVERAMIVNQRATINDLLFPSKLLNFDLIELTKVNANWWQSLAWKQIAWAIHLKFYIISLISVSNRQGHGPTKRLTIYWTVNNPSLQYHITIYLYTHIHTHCHTTPPHSTTGILKSQKKNTAKT